MGFTKDGYDKQEVIFRKFDEILWEYDVTDNAEVFKLLNAYQNTRLDNIQKASNEKQRVALQRTLDYFDFDFVEKYRKSKIKEKLLFRLVNSFVLQIPNLRFINSSTYSNYMFEEICQFREKILGSKDWYLRVIPESAWLIQHLIEIPQEEENENA